MDKHVYIGSELILSSEERDDGLVEVVLQGENGITRTITITNLLFPYIVSEEQGDLTSLRDAESEPIIKAILKVLLDYSPKVDNLEHILRQVGLQFSTSMKIADDKVWGKEFDERRVHDYHQVLMQDEAIPSQK